MSDTDTGSDTGNDNTDVQNPPTQDTGAQTTTFENLEDLPESWQKHIKELRKESARYRTNAEARNTELTAARSEWANKEAELSDRVASMSLEVAKIRAAATAGVPADQIDKFVSRLHGTTAEEIAADAAELLEMFGAGGSSRANPRGVDPSQGRGNDNSNPNSPASAFAALVRDQLAS